MAAERAAKDSTAAQQQTSGLTQQLREASETSRKAQEEVAALEAKVPAGRGQLRRHYLNALSTLSTLSTTPSRPRTTAAPFQNIVKLRNLHSESARKTHNRQKYRGVWYGV